VLVTLADFAGAHKFFAQAFRLRVIAQVSKTAAKHVAAALWSLGVKMGFKAINAKPMPPAAASLDSVWEQSQ